MPTHPRPSAVMLTRRYAVAGIGLFEVDTIACDHAEWSESAESRDPRWDARLEGPGIVAVRVNLSRSAVPA